MPRHLMSVCLVALFLLSTSAIAQGKFVGSEKCMSCHQSIYETWKESIHKKEIQVLSPSNDTVIADWIGEIKVKAGKIPEVMIKFDRGPDGSYLATLFDTKDPYKKMTYTVVITHGGGWRIGQRYLVEIGSNYFILPILWDSVSSKFKPYFLEWWYSDDGSLNEPLMNFSWEMACAGCHSTGMELKKVGNGYKATYSELNTGCEKCHGPGSKHAESPQIKGNIINPRDLSYERGLDVCTQCHSMAAGSIPNGSFGYPWNEEDNVPYIIGESLSDYFHPIDGWVPPSGTNYSLRTIHSLTESKHYEARATCFDCHNPHGGPAQSQLVRADFNNNLCLYCHSEEKEFASPAMVMQHTKHSYDPVFKGTSRCTTCHYIASRRQRTISDTPMPGSASGFLEVIKPQMSLEMFKSNPKNLFTNSCNRCHTEWSGDEAGYKKGVEAYEAKFENQQ